MESRVVAVFLTLLWQSSGSCPNGTYGFQCGYRCNCDQDKCDSTSGCRPPACYPGWSGPTCETHNVARKKATSSSGEGNYPSSHATDGSTASGYLVCIETAPSNPNWWRVDLNDTVLIREVTIYFRLDYKPRRNGIQVYMTNFTDAPSGVNCYNVTGRSDGRDIADVTRAPCSGTGRYILLYTTVNNAGHSLPILDFCEVEVDVCSPGTFGAECDNYCHCDGDVCNYVSSICPSGTCMSGWRGNSCNTTCPMGEYGRSCSKRCTDRMCKDNTSGCNHATGECSDGCLAGYQTPDCTQKCVDTYGENCTRSCSARHCRDTPQSVCDHVTGWCKGGCSPGWKDVDCTTGCVQDVEYGAGCTGNCSARMCEGGSGTCPRDTGLCSDGCQSRWTGDDCTQSVTVSTPQSDDSNGATIGGIVGGVLAVVVVVLAVIGVMFYRRKDNASNINKEHSIYEDISAMEPDRHQVQASQGVNRDEEEEMEEMEEEADRSSYYNIKAPVIVMKVAVDKLGDRIRELQAGVGGFEREYGRLISGFTHPYEDSQREENNGKNRFREYYPYDYNRVVLEKLPGDQSSDYINASYINGYSMDQAYIAAQAPNRKTVGDFWRMIYGKNLTRIVMLTNLTETGKVKCVPYWSDTSDLVVDVFTISVTNISPRAHWVIRELKATLKETGESRLFHHFHYTKWPDHGTPEETALMEFLWRIRKTPNHNTPLMVHCSAGVGRTGTYIAVDYLLDQALTDRKVDVFGFVNLMRQQRRNMIQTKEQYACVYTTLHEALMMGDTTLTSPEFRTQRRAKKVFKMGTTTVSQMMQKVKVSIEELKSAGQIKGRVWVNGRTDILAVMMPSHLSVNGYLLTEAPSVTTASLFWKLTEEQESSTVIVLPDSHQRLASFMPLPGDSLDLSTVIVGCSTETSLNSGLILRKVDRQMEGSASSQLVHVYLLKTFRKDDNSSLSDLLEHVDRNIEGNNSQPITVIFSENERRSATLFCILSNIVQGMKHNNEVEIYNNIQKLGHLCDNNLSQADVSLCYDLASAYLETQNVYANT
ncbi:receptor-type tyrosine-protein phosphatase alpha-like [Haliotis rufescens]|uniref:receptor-type tyrosine-protein phosphatase alpha-like n=1 Tax=Haliotis rufescens TaxID=6454 RepID=UPI00201EEBAD|nr:receptor-type tyrosine-protein phosphatase alpha-like [Haliotis rufescens]